MNRPGITFEKRRGRLVPASALDAEDFDRMSDGTQFEVRSLARRSVPQNNLYWQALENVVKATGRWPTRRHLHRALLRDLGYINVERDLAGEPHLTVDSTAFDAMKPDEFGIYMTAAMARLAEVTQCDPLQFFDEQRAA
jgi:hypothetical protein